MAEALDQEMEAEASDQTFIVEFTIPKAGSHVFKVDLQKMLRSNYGATIVKGLQELCKRGLNDVKTKDLDDEELAEKREEAIRIIDANIEQLYTTELTVRGIKRSKVTGKEKTRAKQKAVRIVKAQIKAEGERISDYSNKEISTAAEQLLDEHPELVEEARAEIAAEEKALKEKGYIAVDGKGKSKLVAGLRKDPKRVAANEAKKVKNPKPKGKVRGEVRASQ